MAEGSCVHGAASAASMRTAGQPARALRASCPAAGTGQDFQAGCEIACYRIHIWSTRGPYSAEAW
jgi:hypothetical protein